MSLIRFCLMSAAVIALMSSGAAVSQTPAPAIQPATVAPSPVSSKPSAATLVETWSRKQWEAAKKEWAKDKSKWADCRKQARGQKLEERNSWPFLYTCMTG